MTDLLLKKGAEVIYHEKRYCIESPISLNQVLLENPTSGEKIPAKIVELSPLVDPEKQSARDNTTDLILISDADWKEAQRREEVLAPLAECSMEQAKDAAKQLGLSWRQIYNLLKRYQNYDRQLLALIPQKHNGGKGKKRIDFTTEQIIQNVTEHNYLNRQQLPISLVA